MEVHIRFWIPRKFKHCLSILRYYIKNRKFPGYLITGNQVLEARKKSLAAQKEATHFRDKYAQCQYRLIEAQKELSNLKRRGN